jgi:hypothetical protein
MEGTPPSKSNNNKEGTRPLTGPALTNDLCGQNVKIKVKIKTIAVLTLTF